MILLLSHLLFLSLQDIFMKELTKLFTFDEKCPSLLYLLMLKATLKGHEIVKSKICMAYHFQDQILRDNLVYEYISVFNQLYWGSFRWYIKGLML